VTSSEEKNSYSRQWFEFFHVRIDEARTIRETEFVCRVAPLPEFQKILDVCCATGRHARALSQRGYVVTGVDRNASAIARAHEFDAGPNYIVADVRDYQPTSGVFDAAIVMGQSFGYFDEATNRDILRRLTNSVQKRGRVLLDLWNPEFFTAHQGEHELKTPRGVVREDKRVDGDRLFVQLDYPDGTQEKSEWQLFTPAQMKRLAETLGLARAPVSIRLLPHHRLNPESNLFSIGWFDQTINNQFSALNRSISGRTTVAQRIKPVTLSVCFRPAAASREIVHRASAFFAQRDFSCGQT
jgi:SAM-dependent methyltransferase